MYYATKISFVMQDFFRFQKHMPTTFPRIFLKLLYLYLMSPYKNKKGMWQLVFQQVTELSKCVFCSFSLWAILTVCVSPRIQRSSSLSLSPTVKFKNPVCSFLWNASRCQLSKTALVSRAQ